MRFVIIILLTFVVFPSPLFSQKENYEFEAQYLSYDSTYSLILPKYMYNDSVLYIGMIRDDFNYFNLIDTLRTLNYDKFYGLYDSLHVALIINGCLSKKCFDLKNKCAPKQSYFWIYYPDEDSSKIFISGELKEGEVAKIFSFYKNGNKRSVEKYTDSGNKSGKWKFYNEEGKLIKRQKYRNGKLIREKNV
jgi:hypothetical protein